MDREQLKKILPHREPMLLVDEAELTPAGTVRGSYAVRGDEWFLTGHFPGNPVVPGVILCEIMAQVSSVLVEEHLNGATPYFTGLDRVRFRRKVLPGDVLEVEGSLVKQKPPFYFIEATGKVGGKVCVSAAFSLMLSTPEQRM